MNDQVGNYLNVDNYVPSRLSRGRRRDQLVDAGLVDDTNTTSTSNGETVGAGDVIATRRNDRNIDVANCDTWTVTGAHPDGTLTVTGETGNRILSAGYVVEHVELAYASTIHGAQGDTTDSGHLVLDQHTTGSAAYVGMTRGRTANTVHLIAEDLAGARAQWTDTAGRGRADLGIALHEYTARRVGQELPQHMHTIRAAEHAARDAQAAAEAYEQAARLARHREAIVYAANWRDTARDLPRLTQHTTAVQERLEAAEQHIQTRTTDPAITSQPDPTGYLTAAHTSWTGDYTTAQADAAQRAQHTAAREAEQAAQRMRNEDLHSRPHYGPDHGRDGPSIGR